MTLYEQIVQIDAVLADLLTNDALTPAQQAQHDELVARRGALEKVIRGNPRPTGRRTDPDLPTMERVRQEQARPQAPVELAALRQPSARWIDLASGNAVRVVGPRERFATEHSELSIGRLIRGRVTGNWKPSTNTSTRQRIRIATAIGSNSPRSPRPSRISLSSCKSPMRRASADRPRK